MEPRSASGFSFRRAVLDGRRHSPVPPQFIRAALMPARASASVFAGYGGATHYTRWAQTNTLSPREQVHQVTAHLSIRAVFQGVRRSGPPGAATAHDRVSP